MVSTSSRYSPLMWKSTSLRHTTAKHDEQHTTPSPGPAHYGDVAAQWHKVSDRRRTSSARMTTAERFKGYDQASTTTAPHLGAPVATPGPRTYALNHALVEDARPCSGITDLQRHEAFGMLGHIPLLPSPGPKYDPTSGIAQLSNSPTPPSWTVATHCVSEHVGRPDDGASQRARDNCAARDARLAASGHGGRKYPR